MLDWNSFVEVSVVTCNYVRLRLTTLHVQDNIVRPIYLKGCSYTAFDVFFFYLSPNAIPMLVRITTAVIEMEHSQIQ